jgi:hypothetical protein
MSFFFYMSPSFPSMSHWPRLFSAKSAVSGDVSHITRCNAVSRSWKALKSQVVS